MNSTQEAIRNAKMHTIVQRKIDLSMGKGSDFSSPRKQKTLLYNKDKVSSPRRTNGVTVPVSMINLPAKSNSPLR